MRAFVTGSTGLVGSNLVRTLIEQGHSVKALARSKEKAKRVLGDLDIVVVEGDMRDVNGFAGELSGCEVLFHTAAYFRESFQPGEHWKLLEEINIKGTPRLLEEAERSGVRKAIYVSSGGVLDAPRAGPPADESAPPGEVTMRNPYMRSKLFAEEAVREFLKGHSLPVVLILPGWIFGPSDAAPTDSGRFVIDFLNRRIPGIIDGGGPVVDARDVARAMVSAVEKGKSGERYIIAGPYRSLEEIMQILEKVSGVRAPKLHIPYAMSLVVAWVMETASRLSGKTALVGVEGVRAIHEVGALNSDKAVRELGATFRPFEETLRDEIGWYRTNGYI